MVSTDPKTFFARILCIGYRCGFTEVGWDPKESCWKYEMNAFRYIWVSIQLAMVYGYHIFLVYRSWLVYSDPSTGLEQNIRIQYLTLFYILTNVNHVVGVSNGRHYVSLINGYNGFVKAQLRNGLPKSRQTRMFAILMLMINILGVIPRTLHVFLRPESLQSLTSLSANPKQLPIGLKGPAAFAHFIIFGFHHFGHWLQFATLYSFACDLVTTMKLLHKSSRSNPTRMARQERALSVLQRNCAELYGQWTLVMQVVSLVVTVLNLYMAVKLGSVRSLLMAVGAFMAASSFWRVLGDVNETSKEVLMDWKRSGAIRKSGLLPRFLQSCRPISIPLGSFFFVDRGFVLTFASTAVNTAASLILAE